MPEDAEPLHITERQRRGLWRLAADAERGHNTPLKGREVPIAAVVGYEDLQRTASLESDLVDVALVLTREATDTGRRTSLDDVIERFGYTREQLNAVDDPA